MKMCESSFDDIVSSSILQEKNGIWITSQGNGSKAMTVYGVYVYST